MMAAGPAPGGWRPRLAMAPSATTRPGGACAPPGSAPIGPAAASRERRGPKGERGRGRPKRRRPVPGSAGSRGGRLRGGHVRCWQPPFCVMAVGLISLEGAARLSAVEQPRPRRAFCSPNALCRPTRPLAPVKAKTANSALGTRGPQRALTLSWRPGGAWQGRVPAARSLVPCQPSTGAAAAVCEYAAVPISCMAVLGQQLGGGTQRSYLHCPLLKAADMAALPSCPHGPLGCLGALPGGALQVARNRPRYSLFPPKIANAHNPVLKYSLPVTVPFHEPPINTNSSMNPRTSYFSFCNRPR